MSGDVLPLPDGEALAARTHAAIDRDAATDAANGYADLTPFMHALVESDLAGLRDALEALEHHLTEPDGGCWGCMEKCDDAPRYRRQAVRCSDGLRATAALYPAAA